MIEADYYDPSAPVLTKGWWWKLALMIGVIAIPTAYLLCYNGHWPFVG